MMTEFVFFRNYSFKAKKEFVYGVIWHHLKVGCAVCLQCVIALFLVISIM